MKNNRLELLTLARSVPDRVGFFAPARKWARSLVQQLEASEHPISHPSGLAAGRIMPLATLLPGQVAGRDVFEGFAAVYKALRAELTPERAAGLGLPPALQAEYQNRPFRVLAARLEVCAQALKGSTEESERGLGRALWFVHEGLRALSPPVLRHQETECVFCHRHTDLGVACHRHRTEHRLIGTPQQRERYGAALGEQEVRIARVLAQAGAMALVRELGTGRNPAGTIQTFVSRHLPGQVSDLMETLVAGSANTLDAVMSAWYTSQEIDDARGLAQARSSGEDKAFVFLHDLVRAEAFVSIGGDAPRRNRPAVSDEQRTVIVELRRQRRSIRDIAKTTGVSTAVVQRVCADEAPGISAPRATYPDALVQQVLSARREGQTYAEIGRTHGLSMFTVSRICAKHLGRAPRAPKHFEHSREQLAAIKKLRVNGLTIAEIAKTTGDSIGLTRRALERIGPVSIKATYARRAKGFEPSALPDPKVFAAAARAAGASAARSAGAEPAATRRLAAARPKTVARGPASAKPSGSARPATKRRAPTPA